MQSTTLTITTEQVKAGMDLFKLTSFEMKTEAFCDICGTSQSGTEKSLKDAGWSFARGAEFCPTCF